MPDHPVMVQDRMTMAHGLEARAPFLDHKLAEYCARLPVTMKIKGRKRRIIQNELAKSHLPREILHRNKQGFSSAITYMMSKELENLYSVMLHPAHLSQAGILNQSYLEKLHSEHRQGKVDHGTRLWLLSSAEMWYRINIENVKPEKMISQLLCK
jgi:asparagine synthase (glutamine-hydrolysing)